MQLKTFFASAVLFSAALTAALGQDAPYTPEGELIAADRGIWEAIAGSHPKMDEVNKALAPDYVDIDSGVPHPREQVVEYLQGLTNFSFHYGRATAHLITPDTGYVIAELSYSSLQNGKPAAGRVLTTTVFSKQQGRWIARLHTEMDSKTPAGK